MMNFRIVRPDRLIDINRISELDYHRIEGSDLVIGALCRHAALKESDLVKQACPMMQAAYEWVAHGPVRNRGTLCGNLCHADPASEMPAVVLAADAVMVLRSSETKRSVPAGQFFVGQYETATADNEILVERYASLISIPCSGAYEPWYVTAFRARLEEQRQVDPGDDEDDEQIERDLAQQKRPVVGEHVPQRLADCGRRAAALVEEPDGAADHACGSRLRTPHHDGPRARRNCRRPQVAGRIDGKRQLRKRPSRGAEDHGAGACGVERGVVAGADQRRPGLGRRERRLAYSATAQPACVQIFEYATMPPGAQPRRSGGRSSSRLGSRTTTTGAPICSRSAPCGNAV